MAAIVDWYLDHYHTVAVACGNAVHAHANQFAFLADMYVTLKYCAHALLVQGTCR